MLVGNERPDQTEQDTTEAAMGKKTFCFLAKFHVYYSGDTETADVFHLFRLRCERREVDALLDHVVAEYFMGLFVEAEKDPESDYRWRNANDHDSTASLDSYEPVAEATFDDISLIPKTECDIDDVRVALLERGSDG